MRIGLVVQSQEGVAWDEWVALADIAEAARLDGLYGSDHYSMLVGCPGGARDIWTVLAGLAARTERIKLGSLVSPVTFRHPSLLAKIVVTAAEIAGGNRIELGLGAGWYAPEHTQHGFPFPPLTERLEMLAEQAEIIRRTWAGGPFDFAGAHYRLEGCEPQPVPATQPRLLLGGAAKRGTLTPAVAFADEYNTPFASVAECRERHDALEAACEKAGKPTLPFSLMMNCLTAENETELERRAKYWATFIGRPADTERTIIGTHDQVCERLAEYAAAGVSRVLLQDLSRNPELMADYGTIARLVDDA